MCCKSKCCGCGDGRDICGPIIPANEKSENYRIALYVIGGLHVAVFIFKCFLMGIFAGLPDVIALVFLTLALIRFDYCQLICYIVINLSEVFALIVVLGYYLQTDMGRNAPGSTKKADDGEEESAGHKKNSINGVSKTNHKSAQIFFRSMFDTYL